MKPNEPGIWEWFDENGTRRLVMVVNVSEYVEDQWLRVYFWGGYYNIDEQPEDEIFATGRTIRGAEWPDRWGNRVGKISDVSEDQLYLKPTKE